MTSILVLDDYDIMWLDSRAILWSIIELSTGITCTCLPTMRVVFKALVSDRLAKILGLGSGSGGTSRPKSMNPPWRSNHYSAIESNSATAKASKSSMQDPESSSGVAEGIRVQEEVKVELQPITPAHQPRR